MTPSRARDLPRSIATRSESASLEVAFDRALSLRLDCLVFLLESETNPRWLEALRGYRRHLEQGIDRAH